MKEKAVKDFVEKQQPFSGIFGTLITVIVTIVLTLAGGSVLVSTKYVSVDSFDVLINKS